MFIILWLNKLTNKQQQQSEELEIIWVASHYEIPVGLGQVKQRQTIDGWLKLEVAKSNGPQLNWRDPRGIDPT